MPLKKIVVGIAIIAVILAICFVWVPASAVRESYGGSAVALRRGIHLRVPLYHRIHRYDTSPIVIDESVEIVTRDNASFTLPVRLTAWPSPGDLLTFHMASSGRDAETFIRERVREALQRSARGLNADQLLTADVARQIVPALSADLIERGIADDGVEIARPGPQVTLNAVIDYLARKFPASARDLARFALEENPEEPLYHTAMGIVLEADGQREGAERAYLDALFLDPASVEPMSRLYLIYQSRRDAASVRRLERLLIAALDKKPDSAIHHHWLGQLYMRLGRLEEARTALANAVRIAPDDPEYLISLGGLEIQAGRLDEARAALEGALEKSPGHALALFNLGVSYAIEGRIDRAIEIFQQAEQAGQPSHALLNALAQAFEEKKDFERAADYLRRSLALRPDQPDRRAALKRIEASLKPRK